MIVTHNLICDDCGNEFEMEFSDIVIVTSEFCRESKIVCTHCGSIEIFPNHAKSKWRGISVMTRYQNPNIPKPSREEIRQAIKNGDDFSTNDKISAMAESARNRIKYERKKKHEKFFKEAVKLLTFKEKKKTEQEKKKEKGVPKWKI
jgi:hypothetical protein